MIGAKAARRRSAVVRDGQAMEAKAREKAQEIADKERAKQLGAHMIEGLEEKVEEAIARGCNRAYDWLHETDRGVMSMAFYTHIEPHFKSLDADSEGYELDWEYNDDHGPDERGRVTFGVTLTW